MEELDEREKATAEKILPLLEGYRADEIIKILFSVQQYCTTMYVFDIGKKKAFDKKREHAPQQASMSLTANTFAKVLFVAEHLCNHLYQLMKRDMGARIVIEYDATKKRGKITSEPYSIVENK